jgi:hypothetical protein
MKISIKGIKIINRVLLFLMVLMASYEVTIAGNSHRILAVWAYTVGFGVLVVSGLMLIILGNDVLEKPLVVIVSTVIPLSISLGLIAEFFPTIAVYYLSFTITGFGLIVITRISQKSKSGTFILAVVHGISGLVIFISPIFLTINSITPLGFSWVSIGGAFIGIGGLMLSFLRAGRQILSQEMIFNLLPVLLFLTTASFIVGFNHY